MTDASVPSVEGSATSLTLLARAIARQTDAWERLVSLYGPLVYHWCRRWGLKPEDAENVGQEVFLRVARRLPQFRREKAGDSFRGWLHRIARNCFIDHHRRMAGQPATVGGSQHLQMLEQAADAVEDNAEPDSSEERSLLFARAMAAVSSQFSPRDWTAFARVVLEGASPAVVAADLGVTPNIVYLAKSRVLKRMREEFAGLIEF